MTTQEKRQKRQETVKGLYDAIVAESKKKSPRYDAIAAKAKADGISRSDITRAFDAAALVTLVIELEAFDKMHAGLEKAAS